MGRLLVYFLLGSVGLSGLIRPWVGVIGIYLVVIMVPQDIWWWHFAGTRPVFTLMIPTLIGFFILAASGGYNIRVLFQKRYIYIMLLWGCYFLSYVLGPYTDQGGPYRWFEPSWVMSNFNKMFLLFFVAWQAGDMMKDRANTIYEYSEEESAMTRLEAWAAAINMVQNFPITGVGLASFGVAYPDHSDKKPREAHNTFFQVLGESGVPAGILYMVTLISAIRIAYRNGNRRKNEDKDDPEFMVWHINEAAMTSLIGLTCCSFFLSMNMSELLYYVIAIIFIVQNINEKRDAAEYENT